jgi:hypothetical protein
MLWRRVFPLEILILGTFLLFLDLCLYLKMRRDAGPRQTTETAPARTEENGMKAPWSFRVRKVRERTAGRQVAFAVFALINLAVALLLSQISLWWALAYVPVYILLFVRVVGILEARDNAVDQDDPVSDDLPQGPSAPQGPDL